MAAEKLNPKQLLFATEYLKDRNATQAAIRAGYSEKSAYSIGHDLLKKPDIQVKVNKKQDEINRDLRQIFAEEAHEAYKVLKSLMMGADNETVQLSAAKDFLDRAGYKPADRIVADVTTRSVEDELEDLVNE